MKVIKCLNFHICTYNPEWCFITITYKIAHTSKYPFTIRFLFVYGRQNVYKEIQASGWFVVHGLEFWTSNPSYLNKPCIYTLNLKRTRKIFKYRSKMHSGLGYERILNERAYRVTLSECFLCDFLIQLVFMEVKVILYFNPFDY